MSGTTDLNRIMFKAKLKVKTSRFTDMEVECEGSIAFLISFYTEFTEQFVIFENKRG